jgi:hypothetical protein
MNVSKVKKDFFLPAIRIRFQTSAIKIMLIQVKIYPARYTCITFWSVLHAKKFQGNGANPSIS